MTYKIEGITYNKTGGIAASCDCYLLKENTTTHIFTQVGSRVVSNATTGAFAFTGLADNDPQYCVIMFKSGSSDVMDITDRNLVPATEATGGGGTVAPQNSGLHQEALGATLDYTGLTVAAGSGLGMVAFVFRLDGAAVSSVKWDPSGANQDMVFMGDATFGSSAQAVGLYTLVNPVPGNKTLRIVTTANLSVCMAQSFTGVNALQATAFPSASVTTFDHDAGAAATQHLTIPSAVGHYVAAGCVTGAGDVSAWTTSGAFIDKFSHFASYLAAIDAGAVTSKNISFTAPSASDFQMIGVDIAP